MASPRHVEWQSLQQAPDDQIRAVLFIFIQHLFSLLAFRPLGLYLRQVFLQLALDLASLCNGPLVDAELLAKLAYLVPSF